MPAPLALNWPALVDEALHRRKAEGLTQKAHAAQAGVSIPTMRAFEHGELTLSLQMASQILDVVGMIAAPTAPQDRFVGAAMARWQELVAPLPAKSPARFQHGSYRIDYSIDAELRPVRPAGLRRLLAADMSSHSGWPMFQEFDDEGRRAHEREDLVECWLAPPERRPANPEKCEFWQASPEGRFVLLRGYSEDSGDEVEPGKGLFLTTPIFRSAEGLLHASAMAQGLRIGTSDPEISFRVTFSGLQGRRVLSSEWALRFQPADDDQVSTALKTTVSQIDANLDGLVHLLVAKVFVAFGEPEFRQELQELVAKELLRFRSYRFQR
jgi:transcriptional regulator with XRE-family HTH domain